MMYSIKVGQFEGPLDLLLTLIEGQELDISQVSLAQVTDQYVSALHQATDLKPEELADFLVVAAKLLYLKSKLLLPGLWGEDDEGASSLEHQLRMYKEFIEASKTVQKMFLSRRVMFQREFRSDAVRVFSPPKKITSAGLRDLFAHLCRELEPIVVISRDTLKKTINLRQKIDEIALLLRGRGPMQFGELLTKAKDKTDVIVTFLALLELVKQRQLVVNQQNMFQSITVESLAMEAQES